MVAKTSACAPSAELLGQGIYDGDVRKRAYLHALHLFLCYSWYLKTVYRLFNNVTRSWLRNNLHLDFLYGSHIARCGERFAIGLVWRPENPVQSQGHWAVIQNNNETPDTHIMSNVYALPQQCFCAAIFRDNLRNITT